MDIIQSAKERLESRRQLLVDIGFVTTALLPVVALLGCDQELDKQLSLLKEGYGPSKVCGELMDIVACSPNCQTYLVRELKVAYRKDLASYMDNEYVTDLMIRRSDFAVLTGHPETPAWLELYLETQIETLEARIEIAHGACCARL